MPTEHHLGEGYSGRNRVPTVQGFRAEQQAAEAHKREQEAHPDTLPHEPSKPATIPEQVNAHANADGAAASDMDTGKALPVPARSSSHEKSAALATPAKQSSPEGEKKDEKKEEPPREGLKGDTESKEEYKKRMNANKEAPTSKLELKGDRVVTDPVTGRDVTIRDANYEDIKEKHIARAALDPGNPAPGPASSPPPDEFGKLNSKNIAPAPAEPTNLHFMPFPPPVDMGTLTPIKAALPVVGLVVLIGSAIIWAFVAFGNGYLAFLWRSTLIGGFAAGTYTLLHLTQRKLEKEIERIRLDMHRQRSEKYSPPTPESVEWLNAALKTVWGLINPEMFVPVADMIEDVMQASLPGFVDAVKIADLGQGTNPVRVISMRGLPDQPKDKEYPRTEWIDGGKPQAMSPDQQAKAAAGEGPDLEQSGEYLNYEISVAYQALPGQSSKLRTANIHMLLQFFLGIYDWLHIPIPIWIEVEGFVATVRLRIQMVPEAPFIRNLTFTLMGIPKVDVSAIPLAKALPNVLDLPLISGFVQSAISAAASEFVAPKSMTLNMAQMLAGDGIKKDTVALGILKVTIHYAVGLSAQDRSGSSDPYCVLAYTKLGKPLFSTRIILSDLNPVWEETAFLLVTADEVKTGEELSLQLWDSDKNTADDIVGRTIVSVRDLMMKPNTSECRTDKLMGFEDADTMPGEITWSVGFYDKAPLNKALKTDGNLSADLPKELRDRPELQEKPTTPADTDEEVDVLRIPPDPEQPSGVLSVIVHNIMNLEKQDLKGSSGKDREGSAGQDTDDPSEEGDNVPSAYGEIVVNDEIRYRTRTKQYTNNPFYEAGTEMFIRDWRETEVRVVIRDARLREHDPILGIVDLPLTEIFRSASQNTRTYSLQDGVGFGRVKISCLFKSFKVDLPKELRGWDLGTVEVLSKIRLEVDDVDARQKLHSAKLKLSTTDSTIKVPSSASSQEGTAIVYSVDAPHRLPVYRRYGSALAFEIGGGGLMGGDADAIALFWLQDIADDEEREVRLPLLAGKKLSQVRQNYIEEITGQHHEYKQIGWLVATVKLDPGLDLDHEKASEKTASRRHNFEVYDHMEGQADLAEKNAHANDDGVIDKEEKKSIDRAQKKQLHSRHRGSMQYGPVRSLVWMKDGVKSRARRAKGMFGGQSTTREPTIETEA